MSTRSCKYLLTFNNPSAHGITHDYIKNLISEKKNCVYYAMSDEIGLEEQTYHTHLFVVFRNPVKFDVIKDLFPTAHIDVARGSTKENRAYVAKTGKWKNSEKSETSVPNTFEESGELDDECGRGHRSDLDDISDMLEDGMNPGEIMRQNFNYRRFEKMIRSAYFDKRKRETPIKRNVAVHYIVGESGTGKSFTYTQLCQERDEDGIYFLTDYDNGGFDLYCGEPVLFMDEYKGQLRFSQLLTITDCYKAQVHSRYANVIALWEEVYITSVFPPEELYKQMVTADARGRDKQTQLLRRITDITYCYIDGLGDYRRYTIPMSQYRDYNTLQREATSPDWVKNIDTAKQSEIIPLEGELPF